MFIIVCGAGKVGYYLTKALVQQDIESVLIEKEEARARILAAELGDLVIGGDASDPRVLEEAGGNRADIVIAVTGDDEDNLVICQVAKLRFHRPRTIARINNPKNQQIFVRLGIDTTISPTELVLAAIRTDLPDQSVVHLASLHQYGLQLVELDLKSSSPAVGLTSRQLILPVGARILGILRNGEAMLYDPLLVFAPGDMILAAVRPSSIDELRRAVVGTAPSFLSPLS
ncbi:MAG: NAD-binding protein [Chloroflexi bacterium]|nr:NAD-binding protein [Chloroflexota bacterium]